jgi:hypothetical protein
MKANFGGSLAIRRIIALRLIARPATMQRAYSASSVSGQEQTVNARLKKQSLKNARKQRRVGLRGPPSPQLIGTGST